MGPTGEHFKLILFALLFIGVVLLCLAILFGQHIGYRTALTICFWYWIVTAAVFLGILLLNLIEILIHKMTITRQNRRKRSNG